MPSLLLPDQFSRCCIVGSFSWAVPRPAELAATPDAGDMGQSIGACNHMGVSLFRHRAGRNRAATHAEILEYWDERVGERCRKARHDGTFARHRLICRSPR